MQTTVVFWSVICLLILGCCVSRAENQVGRRLRRKPRFLKSSDVPYQVFVQTYTEDNIIRCGGAIVSPLHVLTAEYCVSLPDVRNVTVTVGDADKTREYNVSWRYFYKGKYVNINRDIVILKLTTPFPTNGTAVKPIAMRSTRFYTSKKCVASSWKETKAGTYSGVLKVVSVPISPRRECRQKYISEQPGDLMCAGRKSDSREFCQDDYGGPLVCDGLLTGLLRGGFECGQEDSFGAYTDVGFYQPWIAYVISEDFAENPVPYQFRRRKTPNITTADTLMSLL